MSCTLQLEADGSVTEHLGLCVLRANGIDEWRYRRKDIRTFDSVSGFLRAWKIQAGLPPRKSYVQFQFEDYRRVGAVKFPFQVYVDFYNATFDTRKCSTIRRWPIRTLCRS
jgi:hypothetical protein